MQLVVWSPKSQKQFEAIIDGIITAWGIKVAEKFSQQVLRSIDLIAHFPHIYPELSEFKGLRRSVISKQTSMFYKIHSDKIEIVAFGDNRMNPQNLKL